MVTSVRIEGCADHTNKNPYLIIKNGKTSLCLMSFCPWRFAYSVSLPTRFAYYVRNMPHRVKKGGNMPCRVREGETCFG